MANKINKTNTKNVVETLKEIRTQPNMECGIDTIEFPDGTIENFYYNGEADKQAALKFAEICVNATDNTQEAKRMMFICFQLMINNIIPERIIVLENGKELYLDVKKKGLYTDCGSIYVELTNDEKKLKMNTDVLSALLKERAERKAEEEEGMCNCNYDCNEEEDW